MGINLCKYQSTWMMVLLLLLLGSSELVLLLGFHLMFVLMFQWVIHWIVMAVVGGVALLSVMQLVHLYTKTEQANASGQNCTRRNPNLLV